MAYKTQFKHISTITTYYCVTNTVFMYSLATATLYPFSPISHFFIFFLRAKHSLHWYSSSPVEENCKMESWIGEATELLTITAEVPGSSARCGYGDGMLVDLLELFFLDLFGSRDFPNRLFSLLFPQLSSLLNHRFLFLNVSFFLFPFFFLLLFLFLP